MMIKSMYVKRYDNAKRIASEINKLIDSGALVFNNNKEIVQRFIIDECGIYQKVSEHSASMWFIDDIELDNGYYTTIKEYSSRFKEWTYIMPEHIKKVRL